MKDSAQNLINNFTNLDKGLNALNMTIQEFIKGCVECAQCSLLHPEDFVKILMLTAEYDIGDDMISFCESIVHDSSEKNGKRALALVFLMAKKSVGEKVAEKLDDETKATLSLPWVHAMCEMANQDVLQFQEHAYQALAGLIFATKDRKALEALARVIEVCRQSVGIHHTAFYVDIMRSYANAFPPNPDIFITILGLPMYSVLHLQYEDEACDTFMTTIKTICRVVLFPGDRLDDRAKDAMQRLLSNYENMINEMSLMSFVLQSSRNIKENSNEDTVTYVQKSDEDLKKNIQ